MDDVSLSHLEIDFICNKIRGEAVAFFIYPGFFLIQQQYGKKQYKSHSQMLGKVESGGGPIFKVVLEC